MNEMTEKVRKGAAYSVLFEAMWFWLEDMDVTQY